MPDPKHRVTIREVAAQAGVSVATISRVLNGKGPVRETTSRRVMEACQALHFTPHGIARSLSLRRTQTIGLLLPDLHGEFFSEVIRGIDAEARSGGYHLLVSGFHSDRQEMIAVFRAVRGRVDGLIVMSPDREAAKLCSHLPGGFPVVLLNSAAGAARAITIDNYGGARKMIAHLRDLGHERIAFITGPEENEDAAERLRGYRDSVSQTIEIAGDFSEEAGYAAGAQLMNMRGVSAVFAANDAMAVGALSALRDGGLRVPDDIALAGFDDIPIARFVTPPLTTVSVDIAQLGRRAFELLISENEQHETLPATLVIRESCGSKILRGGVKS
ncbi:MAG TPA: LacI family DNA-binding transcriptional regulator [Thermoanaerobaculia bacterium]